MFNNRQVITSLVANRKCILGDEIATPDAAWLAMQRTTPPTTGKWYSAYPLSGGAININENDMEVIRDVTFDDLVLITSSHGFNPASDTVRELCGIE